MKLPKLIKLPASGERLSSRTTKIVVRYHKANIEINLEKYARYLVVLFYPFKDQKQLVINRSYVFKLNEENMLEIVNQNKQIFEPNSDLINKYIHQVHQERNRHQNDNDSVENVDFAVEGSNMQVHNIIDCIEGPQQIALVQADDNDLQKAVRSLDLGQCKTFNIVCQWTNSKLKQVFNLLKCCRNVLKLHVFITGGAGVVFS